jgi:hypothetical protein
VNLAPIGGHGARTDESCYGEKGVDSSEVWVTYRRLRRWGWRSFHARRVALPALESQPPREAGGDGSFLPKCGDGDGVRVRPEAERVRGRRGEVASWVGCPWPVGERTIEAHDVGLG